MTHALLRNVYGDDPSQRHNANALTHYVRRCVISVLSIMNNPSRRPCVQYTSVCIFPMTPAVVRLFAQGAGVPEDDAERGGFGRQDRILKAAQRPAKPCRPNPAGSQRRSGPTQSCFALDRRGPLARTVVLRLGQLQVLHRSLASYQIFLVINPSLSLSLSWVPKMSGRNVCKMCTNIFGIRDWGWQFGPVTVTVSGCYGYSPNPANYLRLR